ncbi:MAG: DUF4040 domain-containing protein [Deltaproteobacteria bacterium]|nr:DUF4040 domain-containing protein [Deltaproteobacteria bacterium]
MLMVAFDLALAGATVGLAYSAIADTHVVRAVMKFTVFGLFLSIAWLRLRAPDVALAEAAVGAGLTGALMLAGVARLERAAKSPPDAAPSASPTVTSATASQASRASKSSRRAPLHAVLLAVSLGFCGLLGFAFTELPESTPGLATESLAALADSGVEHPVTAVLLNYRGYDTLLEIAVLLLSLIAVWSFGVARRPTPRARSAPMLRAAIGWFIPAVALVAAYLLWKGAHAPGGAFQGGAVLAGGLILLILVGRGVHRNQALELRVIAALGLSVFSLVALAVMPSMGAILEYPTRAAGALILLIESFALVSIGLTLGLLFMGGALDQGPRSPRRNATPTRTRSSP